MPVLALSVHAGFQCRHSGACCTAGWPIPVEPEIADAIRRHGIVPETALDTTGRLPDGALAVLAPPAGGACPAFDGPAGNLCSIQRRLGHERLPAACRHFPRVALLEPDAVRVTLSHFCPTAASMLFRPDAARLAAVPDAPGITDRLEHDGFDARHTIPPLLRPGVAMDPGTCRLWERSLLDAFEEDARPAEDMLARAAGTAEEIRGWTAGRDSLEHRAKRALAAASSRDGEDTRWTMTLSSASRLFLLAVDAVPAGLVQPVLPGGAEAGDRAWVLPRWAGYSRPLGRYLAARSFAGWVAYLGEGLRTQVAMLAVALAAVRVEAVREVLRASRPLDDDLLHAAVRAADLLLHHLSDAPTLVRGLAGVERGPWPAFLAAIGLEAAE